MRDRSRMVISKIQFICFKSAKNNVDTQEDQRYNGVNNINDTEGFMVSINTLEEALKYITELEAENKALRAELEHFQFRKRSGRRTHDEAWMASYNDFVLKYEGGMPIMEIVRQSEISRRTAYRYKSYYDEVHKA